MKRLVFVITLAFAGCRSAHHADDSGKSILEIRTGRSWDGRYQIIRHRNESRRVILHASDSEREISVELDGKCQLLSVHGIRETLKPEPPLGCRTHPRADSLDITWENSDIVIRIHGPPGISMWFAEM